MFRPILLGIFCAVVVGTTGAIADECREQAELVSKRVVDGHYGEKWQGLPLLRNANNLHQDPGRLILAAALFAQSCGDVDADPSVKEHHISLVEADKLVTCYQKDVPKLSAKNKNFWNDFGQRFPTTRRQFKVIISTAFAEGN